MPASSEAEGSLSKAGGPFIGPHGGKWADAAHKIAWAGSNDAIKHHREAASRHFAAAMDLPRESTGARDHWDAQRAHRNAASAHEHAGKTQRSEDIAIATSVGEKADRLTAATSRATRNPTRKSMATTPEQISAQALHATHARAAEEATEPAWREAHTTTAGLFKSALEAPDRAAFCDLAQRGIAAHNEIELAKAQGVSLADLRKAAASANARLGDIRFSGDVQRGGSLGRLGAAIESARPAEAPSLTIGARVPDGAHSVAVAAMALAKSTTEFYARHAGGARQTDLSVRIPPEAPLEKAGGPFIGPKGGKWADAAHKSAWHETPHGGSSKGEIEAFAGKHAGAANAHGVRVGEGMHHAFASEAHAGAAAAWRRFGKTKDREDGVSAEDATLHAQIKSHEAHQKDHEKASVEHYQAHFARKDKGDLHGKAMAAHEKAALAHEKAAEGVLKDRKQGVAAAHSASKVAHAASEAAKG